MLCRVYDNAVPIRPVLLRYLAESDASVFLEIVCAKRQSSVPTAAHRPISLCRHSAPLTLHSTREPNSKTSRSESQSKGPD